MSLAAALAVGLGGAFGALLRAFVGRLVRSSFPLATLLVNVAGSFLLAALHAAIPEADGVWRALMGAGFCGALTTFSTFILETVILARSGWRARAVLYVVLTLFLCGLASWLGLHFFGGYGL